MGLSILFIRLCLCCIKFRVQVNFSQLKKKIFKINSIISRCLIKECETISTTDFTPNWLKHAVPYEKTVPSNCFRYKNENNSICSENSFNNSYSYRCDEFVYKTKQKTLVNEVINVEIQLISLHLTLFLIIILSGTLLVMITNGS